MAKKQFLTENEKTAIRVLNYIATFDGIITSNDDIFYLLNQGVQKFIPKGKRNLVSINEDSYPLKIRKTIVKG
jgi:hypothetical protein